MVDFLKAKFCNKIVSVTIGTHPIFLLPPISLAVALTLRSVKLFNSPTPLLGFQPLPPRPLFASTSPLYTSPSSRRVVPCKVQLTHETTRAFLLYLYWKQELFRQVEEPLYIFALQWSGEPIKRTVAFLLFLLFGVLASFARYRVESPASDWLVVNIGNYSYPLLWLNFQAVQVFF